MWLQFYMISLEFTQECCQLEDEGGNLFRL